MYAPYCRFFPNDHPHMHSHDLIELTKIKSSPTNLELASQIEQATHAVRPNRIAFSPHRTHSSHLYDWDFPLTHFLQQIQKVVGRLEPLRSGSTLVSAEDLALLDKDWEKWRAEWIRRRKIFRTYVSSSHFLLLLRVLQTWFSPRDFGSLIRPRLPPHHS